MRIIITGICLIFICLTNNAEGAAQAKDARGAVQKFFTLLKTQQYAALYDFLPSRLQTQMTREQLAFSMRRLDSFIVIERMEIGRMQQKGELAVIDTTIYGRLKKPLKVNEEEVTEGRASVQQYLFKENNQWKVATADNRTRDYFLKRYPQFNQQFQFTQPRFEFKQGGRWMPLAQAMKRPQ